MEGKNMYKNEKEQSRKKSGMDLPAWIRGTAMLLTGVIISWSFSGISAAAQPIPGIPSVCYIAQDMESGEVLADLNADVPVYPASTTKVMTAMAVMDVLAPTQVLVVSPDTLARVDWDNSKIGLKAGGEYFVYELLIMMLVSSAGDAAQVLAEAAYGSADACVAAMNQKATALELTSTHFDNIFGLDVGNGYMAIYTTARDYAKILTEAQKYEWIKNAMALPSYAIPPRTNNPSYEKQNTNAFLTTEPYNTAAYHITGGKTGTTKAAGNSLAVTSTNGKKQVLCVSYYNPNREVLYTSIRGILDTVYAN